MAPSRWQVGHSSYTYPWAVGLPGHVPHEPQSAGELVERAVHLSLPVVAAVRGLTMKIFAAAAHVQPFSIDRASRKRARGVSSALACDTKASWL